jgi:hypothetical protein
VTRRYTEFLPDGRPALPTSIRYLVTVDELAAGLATVAVERGYHHRLRTHHETDTDYWTMDALDEAERAAARLGRGLIMTAVRQRLEAGGYGSMAPGPLARCFTSFPEEVARRRVLELWPLLDPDPVTNPFAPRPGGDD